MSFDASSRGSQDGQIDPELRQFIEVESQKAKYSAQVHSFTDQCWDKCIDKPGSKLDSRTEQCLVNCVERFIDVSLTIANKFQRRLEQGGGL